LSPAAANGIVGRMTEVRDLRRTTWSRTTCVRGTPGDPARDLPSLGQRAPTHSGGGATAGPRRGRRSCATAPAAAARSACRGTPRPFQAAVPDRPVSRYRVVEGHVASGKCWSTRPRTSRYAIRSTTTVPASRTTTTPGRPPWRPTPTPAWRSRARLGPAGGPSRRAGERGVGGRRRCANADPRVTQTPQTAIQET
jgi:hypothetical protein